MTNRTRHTNALLGRNLGTLALISGVLGGNLGIVDGYIVLQQDHMACEL